MRALSGFYYVDAGGREVCCRARGRFRHEKITPLVGDRVSFSGAGGEDGVIDAVLPRKNAFLRPPVANLDVLVLLASEAVPVTDPFLLDRMTAIAERAGVEPFICVNKCDLADGKALAAIYERAGFSVFRTSAATGEGVPELSAALSGKVCAFSGNSGVGKSSLLNALDGSFAIPVGEVSDKLGRGRHTTRCVGFYKTAFGALIADTPGFAAFDTERMELTDPAELQKCFREFRKYSPECRFVGCAHTKERGCAVLDAVRRGDIPPSRHRSYVRLYEELKNADPYA